MTDPKTTRRGMRVGALLTAATVCASLALTGLPAPAGGSAGAAPPSRRLSDWTPKQKVARWGGGWLARQIEANGGYVESFGKPDVANTAYAIVSLHAAGVGAHASQLALNYLRRHLGAPLKTGGEDAPGRLGYTILAAVSAGRNPTRFGGNDPRNNLVTRLLRTARTAGRNKGLFGSQAPTFDGAFRQGIALAALAAAGRPASQAKVASGIEWLKDQQCPNGMWASYRAKTGRKCPAVNPQSFTGPDTNSTGLAIQGLAAYDRQPRRARLLERLHDIQSADGGFPYLAKPGQASDPNSTALSIQAILAVKGAPGSAPWMTRHSGPYRALASYQLRCGAPKPDRGAFYFPGSHDPNVLATVPSVQASASATLPLTASVPSPATPRLPCAA
ncbi:MAG: hypothetical protein ABJA86_09610 [Nocardioidaceae bacterium]